MFQRLLMIGATIGGFAATAAAQTATLTPLATFGGGDGWRKPGEVLAGDTAGTNTPSFIDGSPYYNFLSDGLSPIQFAPNLERGIAYNPTTGNLLLVSRALGNQIRILNGTTGVDIGALNKGTDVVAGGTFPINMGGVTTDGAIYVANLTTDGSLYRIYRWANEAATPTVAYTGASPLAGARTGDTLDVIGSGATTRLVAGYGGAPVVAGNNSYAVFTSVDGLTYAGANVAIGTNPPAPGDFRLGITFGTSSSEVWGKQTGGTPAAAPVHQTSFTGTTGTLLNSGTLTSGGEAPMDYAVVGGTTLLATVDVNSSLLRVYDVTTPATPSLLVSATTTSGLDLGTPGIPGANSNLNGTGQVKFGPISGNTATIYAMSTNQGIQAFTLTLPATGADDADFDADGDVDGADFLTWQRGLGLTGTADLDDGDANNDNDVDADDLAIWKAQFGPGAAVGAVAAIPEPHAVLLAGLAAAGLGGLRRRRA